MSTPRGRAPARQAAKKASNKFETQLMSSPIRPDDSPLQESPSKGQKRPRARPKKTQVASSSKVSLSTPGTSKKARAGSRKRPISLDLSRKSDDDLSDLTALSARTGTPPPRVVLPSRWEDGDKVWVLLDAGGSIFEPVDDDDGVERLWWPGMVESVGSPFQVRLFGKIGTPRVKILKIDTPTSDNIIPIHNELGAIRFTEPSFSTASPPHNNNRGSPQKRQKLDRSDLVQRWHDAMSEAVKHILEYDRAPLVFLSSVQGWIEDGSEVSLEPPDVKAKGKGKGKARVEIEPDFGSDFDDPVWDVDDTLNIPGEKILALDKKIYWPAKILEYVKPSNPRTHGRYKILWLDGTQGSVLRNEFYSPEQDEFGTCPIGSYDSVFKDVLNDSEDDDDGPEDARPSPEPLDPLPSGTAFSELTMREQFVHAKPVLAAILRGEYAPARGIHDLYTGGGLNGRTMVAEAAGDRGLMDPKDVEEVQKYLVEWCMRNEKRHTNGLHLDADMADEKEKTELDATAATMTDGAVTGETVVSATNDRPPAIDEAVPDSPPQLTTEQVSIVETINLVPILLPSVANDDDDLPVLHAHSAPTEPRLASNSPTPSAVEEAPSSPAPPPPLSSFSSFGDVLMESDDAPTPHEDTDLGAAFDTASTLSELSDLTDLSAPPPVKPPRQVGCEAYEKLTVVEKLVYCTNVLLPELLVQLFLWRAGKRRSVELLSPEEEEELHRWGEDKRKETDWVWEVNMLRKKKESKLKSKEKVIGGTASRPKKTFMK
ncbi:hypothetical protein C8J57DRAFT_1287514 [Mycena rebaudengoi]|nr:hypothetical protein C8J57DRAFT_1287514 [Mycena rebaudengoi]